jgi:osmotically-inducible protein OsmY
MRSGPVVICYDGSDLARAAISAAARLLGPRDAVVLDVGPIQVVAEAYAADGADAAGIESIVLQDATAEAERGAVLANAAGFKAVARGRLDTATWHSVVTVAEEIDAAAIVVGTRGLSGVRELVHGSLAHELAQHARRPVLIVPPHPRKEQHTMSGDKLQKSVSDELEWDPKIDNEAIAVATDGGAVTLRGTVGSFREKREAQKAAERVYGVTSVDNELKVRILDNRGRDDAELRGDILQALMLDVVVPKTVDARVSDGWVTLTGKATWGYQRDEAELVAGNVYGVVGLDDTIELESPPADPGEVKDSIKKALKRNAKLDADMLSVDTKGGTVTLKGVVSSWAEHDAAIAAAWAAPGVTQVADNIVVDY